MICNIDIETMPQQGGYEAFLEDAKSNFKAPSTLTKTQACADLGLAGNDAKFTSKDNAIAQWVARFSQEKAPQVAAENWRKTSLDGTKGEIFSIVIAIGEEPPISFARTVDDLGVFSCEAEMLSRFFATIKAIRSGVTPYFVGHNIGGFDMRFIYRRCVINGVKPSFEIPHNGRHGQHFFDTMTEWAGFGNRISQDNLCKALGIEGKPDDINGSQVWDYLEAGKLDRVVEYNIDDVVKNREIYKRLTFTSTISE